MSYPPFSSVTWTTSWTSRGRRTHGNLVRGLVFHLYNDCGAAFLDQLQGFFAFCIVDAGSATVFAAVDRHASIPLYKARSKGGRVFIAHLGERIGAIKLSTLGEMSKIPAGSYVHGNRHINPHKYAGMVRRR